MKIDIIALISLVFVFLSNIVAIVIFLTKQADNTSFLEKNFYSSKNEVKKMVAEYRNNISKKFDEFKSDIYKQIEKNQIHTEYHIKRLEEKQDKHNNIIERMVRVEDSTKSAHRRIDELRK